MNKKQNQQDRLAYLFRQMPDEELRDTFCADVMRTILQAEQKRQQHKERMELLAILLVSLMSVVAVVALLVYKGFPAIEMTPTTEETIRFYWSIGVVSLLLLLLDKGLRRVFYRDK